MGGKGSGKKPKSYFRRDTERILAETSPEAAKVLKEVVTGIKKGVPATVIDTCKYIINQDLGSPTQKVNIAGRDGKDIVIEVVYVNRNTGKD